jgi:flagellar motor protein MotB
MKKIPRSSAFILGIICSLVTTQYVLANDNQLTQPVKLATQQTPATGYGKKRPVAPNQHPDGSDNPAGRQQNRRVEVVIDTCH